MLSLYIHEVDTSMQLKSIQRAKTRKRIIPIRVTEKEYILIQRSAFKFQASMSEWLREAGMKYIPKDEDIVIVHGDPDLDDDESDN